MTQAQLATAFDWLHQFEHGNPIDIRMSATLIEFLERPDVVKVAESLPLTVGEKP